MDFEKVFNKIKKYISDKSTLDLIEESYIYAEKQHRGQKRKSGEDFIIHPLWTTYRLASWNMGKNTLIAGMLHDVLEDTPSTEKEIKEKFGEEVYNLIYSVTKVSYFAKENRTQIKAQYLRKLYLSLSKDIRVIIIKLADRLHNVNTLQALPIEKQRIIAKESLEIYSAIAHRLGMTAIKNELEDLCFKILEPEEYNRIIHSLELSNQQFNLVLDSIIKKIETALSEKNMQFKVLGRTKSIYSIYRKTIKYAKNFEDIHDILAVRIITNNVDECYAVLGIVHSLFSPLQKRFKDYIAVPKNNLYKSIHTTLVTEIGIIFEMQIRTKEMDDFAEHGIASHWRYKEGEVFDLSKKQKDIDERLNIFQGIQELETSSNEYYADEKEPTELIESAIKNDIFSALVYALTPEGKVVTLPSGSTILDFAYKIHSEIGEKTIGAKINGAFSSLSTVVKSGDVVEVKTATHQHPNHSWMLIAKTSSAKNKIKKYLRKEQNLIVINDDKNNLKNIKLVKEQISKYISEHNLPDKMIDEKRQKNILNRLGYNNLDIFLLDVQNGKYSIREAVKLLYINKSQNDSKLINYFLNKEAINVNLGDNKILVQDEYGIRTKISSCCRPVPNEQIIGYVSRYGLIKVHRVNCKNLINDSMQERKIEVSWNINVGSKIGYETLIGINALDRPGLITEITKIFSNLNVEIRKMKASVVNEEFRVKIMMLAQLNDKQQLDHLLKSLRSLSNIISAEREYA
ncbi:RelA/SpoT family protein [Spiroplasma endosymbiont of Amphibalanus improvisus]|uniref:RelA/SpoT family protein n=1 Tax=Spiroplasma endosymbiont of Amphibalanus improvisus TaxID=3066327 RepID=UPI00313F2945